MKTLQIQDGLILICGPSTSGKTTLAKRLFDEMPYRDKFLLSHDEFLKNYLKKKGRPMKDFYDGLKGESDSEFKTAIVTTIRDAFARHECVVYESLYCVPENLAQFLAIFPALGLKRPMTLIKLWVPQQLQMQFLKQRPDSRRVDIGALISQRQSFATCVESNYFAGDIEWIKEYVVNDPRDVRFDFRKKGEITNELMAAYEAWEECKEKIPDFVQFVTEL